MVFCKYLNIVFYEQIDQEIKPVMQFVNDETILGSQQYSSTSTLIAWADETVEATDLMVVGSDTATSPVTFIIKEPFLNNLSLLYAFLSFARHLKFQHGRTRYVSILYLHKGIDLTTPPPCCHVYPTIFPILTTFSITAQTKRDPLTNLPLYLPDG